MPHRLVSVLILVGWSLATGALVVRDVLPDLIVGPPPDMRTISLAGSEARDHRTRWAILVADDLAATQLRAVGQATTDSFRQADGCVRFSSEAWFDSQEALKGTRLAPSDGSSERIEMRGSYDIDQSGNLNHFWASVRLGNDTRDALVLNGSVRQNTLDVRAEGPVINWKKSLVYQPRGIVQGALGPLDRMPGIQVGQRWKSHVVSPLTGAVQEVTVEVPRRRIISWDGNPVTTLEVVTYMPPMFTARTWVRQDGLVLRQEAPFPFVRLVLERQPDRPQPRVPETRGRRR